MTLPLDQVDRTLAEARARSKTTPLHAISGDGRRKHKASLLPFKPRAL
jgi:hypothetical protein